MALTLQETTTTTTTKTADKQIAMAQIGASVDMYTVPSGRKFKGFLGYQQTSDTSGGLIAYIDSQPIYHMTKSGPIYLELAAGATVQSSSATYRTFLFGVESDV